MRLVACYECDTKMECTVMDSWSWMTTAKEEIGTRTWWHLEKSSFIKAGVNGIRPTRPSGEMIHRTCCHSSIVIYYFFEFL